MTNHPLTTKEQHWVYQSIANWANFSTDRAGLKAIADKGFSIFHYLRGQLQSDNIHAYFGYYQGRVYLHFVPSSVDITSSFKDPKIIPAELYSCISTDDLFHRGPIEKSDAEIRIQKWEDHVIRNKVLDTADFFQIFWIPNDDFKENSPLKINMAIHNNQVDLVLTPLNKTNSFLDTCRPIPPFKPAFTESQFALLLQVKIWNTK